MEATNNMGADKQRKIDHEVKEIHAQVKKSSLILRQRMRDLKTEMTEWTLGEENGESEGITE